MRHLFLVIAVIILLPPVQASEPTTAPDRIQAVLVTGASSGIGRKITEVLAAEGYFVYAGARKRQDLEALNQIDNVQSIRLDVTVQEEIDAAASTIRAAGRGLYGLVNNAGVAIGGPLIEVEESELQWLFDVNVFGPYRITQAFAPLIIEQQGRIANIGSISGIGSSALFGQYSMSKHAIEAYSDSLAAEMARFNVGVSVIEPGNYRSKIGLSANQRMRQKSYAQDGSPFAEDMQRFLSRPADRSQYKEPDEVAAAVLHALFDPEPKRRYMVVPQQSEADWTIRTMIGELIQLNQDQPYAFSRDQLVQMLDEALGAQQ